MRKRPFERGEVMKAFLSITFSSWTLAGLLICSCVSEARPINPGGQVSEVILDQRPQQVVEASPSNWNKIQSKVKNWYENAKSNFFDNEKKTAKQPVKKVPPKPDPIEELAKQLPDMKATGKGLSPSEFENLKKQIDQGGVRVAVPGQAADPSLPKNKAGVPIVPAFNKKKVNEKTVYKLRKKIPSLNVGVEDKIDVGEFLISDFKLAKVPAKKASALKSPKVLGEQYAKKTLKNFKVTKSSDAKDPRKEAQLKSELVTQKMIDSIQMAMKPDVEFTEKEWQEFSENDLKLLAALTLYKDGKGCSQVMGLFHDLEKDKRTQKESEFYIGACAQQLKHYATGYRYLSRLIREENPIFAERAMKFLSEDLPRDYEGKFAKLVLGLKNQALITHKIQDAVFYRVAKGSYDNKKFKTAKNYAGRVSSRSPYHLDALYVNAVSSYALGHTKTAEKDFTQLYLMASKNKGKNKNILSVTTVNLARLKFTQEKYKEAIQYFQNVKKDHSLWVRALVEQGWAQLMLGDAAGAIGNMYSLHSPYFKTVYKPESYVVRTIGYLNICQYGDAYKTLSLLESDYRPWHSKVSSYIQINTSGKAYYDTVTKYLTGKSIANVDGLPFQIIREMARQKGYLNAQASINENFDERARHSKVIKVIKKKRSSYRWWRSQAKKRLAKLRMNIKKSKNDSLLLKKVPGWNAEIRNERKYIRSYTYLIKLMGESGRSFLKLRKKSVKQIARENFKLRARAGKALAHSLKDIRTDMNRMLSNNEFLRYEVFAGSGINLRYQVAGGDTKVAQRIPASVKPEKALNWSFSGEYWEDEIGSYRSSLKNNCPKLGNYPVLPKKNNI